LVDDKSSNTDKGYDIKHVSGHVTVTDVTGNNNTTNVSVSGDIKADKNILSNLEPEFQKSITELGNSVKEALNDKQVTAEEMKLLTERVNELGKEFEGVKPDATVVDEEKKDDIKSKLINLADAVLALAPDVAEKIASVTPLAPFSKVIEKGADYFSNLIRRKLPNPKNI
jgi:hypothetical protein